MNPILSPSSVAQPKHLGLRVLYALMGAFTGMTACWIVWGLVTPGDFFANGNPLAWVTVLGVGAGGAYAAFMARSRSLRIALAVATMTCTVFWLAVPNGWWARAP